MPVAIAMFMIGPVTTPLGWSAAMVLVGITNSIAATIGGTLLPTLFGTAHLGSVRSIATAIMVFSTAIGPGITGWFIDRGVNFPDQGVAMGLWSLFLSAALLPVMVWTLRLQQEKAPV